MILTVKARETRERVERKVRMAERANIVDAEEYGTVFLKVCSVSG